MRKIVVDGKTFEWKVGRSNIKIRSDKTSLAIGFHEAFPNVDIERAQWKKYFNILPSDIEKIIRRWGLV